MPTLTHEQAVERGKKGGAAGKGKHKAVDPVIAHARAVLAGFVVGLIYALALKPMLARRSRGQ